MANSVRRFFPQQIFRSSEALLLTALKIIDFEASEMQEAFLKALIIFDDEVTKSNSNHLHIKKQSLLVFPDKNSGA